MAEQSTDKTSPKEPLPEALFSITETTTDEHRTKGTRTYELVIVGKAVLLATSLRHTRPALSSETGQDEEGEDEEYETVTVLGSQGDKRREAARFVLEFTPPLASDAERSDVVAHLGVVTFMALATSPSIPSMVDAPLPEAGPEVEQPTE